MLISDRLRWCAWKKIYPNVALIRRARNLPETRFWPITVRIEYRKLSSNTLLEKREAMKKVGERNVTRKEGYRGGARVVVSKKDSTELHGKGEERKIRFTRNTLVNSLPIEKFRTRVSYNFSYIVISFCVSVLSFSLLHWDKIERGVKLCPAVFNPRVNKRCLSLAFAPL